MMRYPRSKKWYGLVMLLAAIGGSFFYLEALFDVLRVRSISFSPQEAVSEGLFWENLNSEYIRWWPLLYLNKREISTEMEQLIPVEVMLRFVGFGKLQVKISSINPSFIVRWENILWYVDLKGKIWKKSQFADSLFPGMGADLKPILEIGNGFPVPLQNADLGNTEKAVFQGLLPMDLIQSWIDALSPFPWFEDIEKIVMQRNAGDYLLMLRIRSDKGWIELLLKPDTGKWIEIVEALGKIMPKFPVGYSNIFIDATYKDKIVVKDIISGVR